MARKGWESLSESYRNRLMRGGITEQGYASGESLSHARGHGGIRDIGVKDTGSSEDRSRLEDAFIRNMHRQLGDYFKFNTAAIRSNARKATVQELKLGAAATEEQLLALAKGRGTFNPFWYH